MNSQDRDLQAGDENLLMDQQDDSMDYIDYLITLITF